MYKKTTLDNGLRIVSSKVPTSRSISICFFIGIGSRYETAEVSGISHFVEHLCFKGTKRRPSSREVSLAIEGIGGMLNGGTDKEATVYWSKVALPNFSLALDVLVDMLRSSMFVDADVEKERSIIAEELNLSRDIPGQLVDLLIDEVMWPDQPLGRDVAGTRESVNRIQQPALIKHWKGNYVPGNTVITVAGDMEHDSIVEQIGIYLNSWTGSQRPYFAPAIDDQDGPRMKIEAREIEQTHLCLSLRGLPANHPDRFALDLLNVILGEGMTSRLFLVVREKFGLAYEVNSAVNHYADTGMLTVYAGVDPSKLELALSTIIEELTGLCSGIPDEEITRAKEFSKGRLLLRMEDTRAIAGWLGGQELLINRILTVDDVIAKIDALTSDDLKNMAKRIISGKNINLAVVGPVRNDGDRIERLLYI